MKQYLLLFTIVLFVGAQGFCQSDKIARADKYFEKQKYKKAVKLYQKILKKNDNKSIKKKVAEAYKAMDNWEEAELFYWKSIEKGSGDICYPEYARALIKNGKRDVGLSYLLPCNTLPDFILEDEDCLAAIKKSKLASEQFKSQIK